jgi:hypothetical protein
VRYQWSAVVAVALMLSGASPASAPAAEPASAPAAEPAPVPRAQCGPGSKPETGTQGRVSAADVASGRAAKGYTCNMQVLGHYGNTGGLRVHRYVDHAGHECAFYDTALLFPTNLLFGGPDRLTGVYVMDMSDPAHPVHTDTLLTPAMESPHESLSLNATRGLLAADMGYPTFNPGFVDLYDVSEDCRYPSLKSSTPLGILGHEGSFSPDGNTFWVSSTGGKTLTALDVSDPSVPVRLFTDTRWVAHGFNLSDDGNRLYLADISDYGTKAGLTVLDTSQVQRRVPNPTVPVVSHLSWPDVSIPQTNLPVRIGGHPYLVEVDEFSRQASDAPSMPVGGARIIDIADEKRPHVVSTFKLEVNTTAARATDQRTDSPLANRIGYTGHYCSVPRREEPGVVACSFVSSGMRLFDIRDPRHPKEIAYANLPGSIGSYNLSAAAFVPERGEIWFSDGFTGFYAAKVTNGVWPFSAGATVVGQRGQAPTASAPSQGGGTPLPATGRIPSGAQALVVLLVLAGLGLRWLVARSRATRDQSALRL